MEVSRMFSFDAAHYLPGYKGKCSQLHGHTWNMCITFKGMIDERTGMVVDFKIIDEFVGNVIISKLDHKLLNTVLKNPTAENLILWVWTVLGKYTVLIGVKLSKIELWETQDSCVTLTRKEFKRYVKHLKETLKKENVEV